MTSKKKIEELQRRLDNLKEKEQDKVVKPTGNIGLQFEEIGKSFRGIRESIPKVKIKKDKPAQPIQYDPGVNKLRRVLLWILTLLIGGLALILIISRVLTRLT